MSLKDLFGRDKGQKDTAPTSFMKEVFATFGDFQNEECYALKWRKLAKQTDEYITSPLPDSRLEREWKKIEKNSPIPLPEDYKELFYVFGGSTIENRRDISFLSCIRFWTWEDITFFEDQPIEEFWEECPKMLPWGDELGDRFYAYGEGPQGLGVYCCEFGAGSYWEEMDKLADSFTLLFTDKETQKWVRENI